MRSLTLAVALLFWLGSASRTNAGLYHTQEPPPQRDPDCSRFLVRLMVLREYGPSDPRLNKPDAPHRTQYLGFITKLKQKREQSTLTADEIANLGYYLIRVRGTPAEPTLYLTEAIDLLVPASRQHPRHFQLQANLGTAFHLLESPEALEQAENYLTLAVELAPDEWREFERTHLRLVKVRRRAMLQTVRNPSQPRPTEPEPDNILSTSLASPVRFVGQGGQWEIGKLAESQWQKLPNGSVGSALEHVQQLLIWLPYDMRLLWMFGELACLVGQHRAALRAIDSASYNNSALSDVRRRVILLTEYLNWQDVLERSTQGPTGWLVQNVAAGLHFATPGDATTFLTWCEEARRGVKVPGMFEEDSAVGTIAGAPPVLLQLTPKHWLLIALGLCLILVLMAFQFREWRRRRAQKAHRSA